MVLGEGRKPAGERSELFTSTRSTRRTKDRPTPPTCESSEKFARTTRSDPQRPSKFLSTLCFFAQTRVGVGAITKFKIPPSVRALLTLTQLTVKNHENQRTVRWLSGEREDSRFIIRQRYRLTVLLSPE